MRIFVPLLLIGVMAIGAFGAYWGAYVYFRAEVMDRAAARLSLYRSTVVSELERFSHLTFVLANDSFVIATARGGNRQVLNERLAGFADRAGIDAIYLMDLSGVTQSASNAGTTRSFVGQDYSFRPYFQQALNGRQGQFYGIGATTGIPGYFYAEAVNGPNGAALGVIAIKIDLSKLQTSWQEAGEKVILANADGISLLASEPNWRYRAMSDLSPAQVTRIADARQFSGQDLPRLDWMTDATGTAQVEGEDLLHLSSLDLPNDWALHYFTTDDVAVTRSWLATAIMVFLAGSAFIIFQIQRNQRIGRALQRSEAEEAQLRLANERLAIEIEDRRAAERKLQRTQTELERASRLAALGQLSASVTHELGQPITAMRNHLTVAEMQGGPSKIVDKMKDLVDRMEGITRQLKFFARKGRDNFEDFDLRDAHAAALELLAPNLKQQDVKVTEHFGEDPLVIYGNRLRIEQVMTNLLRNALDATEAIDAPKITVEAGTDENTIWYQIADNGHGLDDQNFDDLKEPFRSTRESGKGMGLGLTISAGIVEDHNGHLKASNGTEGGAVFRATFPAPTAEEVR